MQKKFLLRTFLVLLCLGIVYACVNEKFDGIFGSVNKSVPKEVVAAQAWYSANVGETVVFKIADAQEETFVQPVWSTAVMKQNSEYETVEVIVRSDKKFFLYDNEILAKYEETRNVNYITSRTLFVVRTDRKTGETDGFFMTVTPNLAYLEETEMHPYRNFTYLERDKHFGGYVYYHHLDGNYSNAWKYVDGKPYAMYLPESVSEPELPEQETGERSKQLRAANKYKCYAEINTLWIPLPTFTYYPPETESPEALYGGDLPEVVIESLVRNANNLSLSVKIACEEINSDSGGGGGGGSGGEYTGTIKQIPYTTAQYKDTGGYQKESCNCMCVAQKIMKQILGNNANIGSSANVIQLYLEDENGSLYLVGNVNEVFTVINNHIANNRPIIAGVNHTPKVDINEGATDHWIVITGRGYDTSKGQSYYTFVETGRSTEMATDAIADSNRLYYNPSDGKFSGPRWDGTKKYTLTQIRPNI